MPTHGRNKPGATSTQGLPPKEETMINTTRRTLGTVAAALLAGLCWSSGASAQSGNPIKVGVREMRKMYEAAVSGRL